MHSLHQLLSGELKGTKHLKLSCGLTTVPPEVFALADSLEILDLSGNQLSALPDQLPALSKLRIAFFSDNLFTEWPSILSQCTNLEMIGFKANKIRTIPAVAFPPALRWLILTDNKIESFPASIGSCCKLQKLMLAGNKLQSLPQEMANCRNLELLRISANQLICFPEWLLDLPKLSWLAFAGNPFSVQSEYQLATLPKIDWKDLTPENVIGQGASGIISKALWNTRQCEVAIKVFKGHVTSDGWPQDELNACLRSGLHENLIPLQGQVIHHPEGRAGLVMELLPPGFRNLGGPPDFITCTRDTFSPDTSFTWKQINSIVLQMARVATHLHEQGVMHGDLYAHNILINQASKPLFGDFGAATVYDRENDPNAHLFEKIEVRAFGCLVEDLILRVSEENKELFSFFNILKDSCFNEKVIQRSSFRELLHALEHTDANG